MNHVAQRVGHDAIQVRPAEHHDAAWHAWRAAGVARRTILHIDAHHDLWRAPDRLTISDFLGAAVAEGMVSRVLWAVPDPSWQTEGHRAEWAMQLARVARSHRPGRRVDVAVGGDRISADVGGVPVVVAPLRAFHTEREPLLLDIDTDYLVVAQMYLESDAHRQLPWCTPEALVSTLTAHAVTTDLVTLAYSVEGGYTPLRWKFLADEIAARLGRASEDTLVGFAALRDAAAAFYAGNLAGAGGACQRAASLLPGHPAPAYWQALIHRESGCVIDAQACYARAVELDGSYATPYRSAGLAYFRERRYVEARQEHERALQLDPGDAVAHLGLSRLALHEHDGRAAETHARRALTMAPCSPDAHRALAEALAHLGQAEGAIAAFEQSLASARAGHRTLEAPLATESRAGGPSDPGHGAAHVRLAQLHRRIGNTAEAMEHLEAAVALGNDGVRVRLQLASLYVARGRWASSTTEMVRVARQLPVVLRAHVRNAWLRARSRMRRSRWAMPDYGRLAA